MRRLACAALVVALGMCVTSAVAHDGRPAAPAVREAAPAGPDLEEVFIQGMFQPAYTPPAPGTYELPAIARVRGYVLRDTTGRPVDTRALTRGKVAVVSFIYTACSDRLGCP